MANITYLLGAGASCKALPLVKDFKEKGDANPLIEFRKWIEGSGVQGTSSPEKVVELLALSKQLISDIDWTIDRSLKHETVDTFAKKLFITGGHNNVDLLRLKRTMASFFIAKQFRCPVDTRYDTFFASITEPNGRQLKLPGGIKVISWNYDLQLEMGLLPYVKGTSGNIGLTHSYLNSYPGMETVPGAILDLTRFATVHLNGKAGFFYNYKDRDFGNVLPQGMTITRTNEILEIYSQYNKWHKEFSDLFSFAWEDTQISKGAISNAIEIAKNTEVLIIIGYSFPFFNREIDRQILNSMEKLTTVYYQVPKVDFHKYVSRLKGIVKKPIHPDMNVVIEQRIATHFPMPQNQDDPDQFFIPYDL